MGVAHSDQSLFIRDGSSHNRSCHAIAVALFGVRGARVQASSQLTPSSCAGLPTDYIFNGAFLAKSWNPSEIHVKSVPQSSEILKSMYFFKRKRNSFFFLKNYKDFRISLDCGMDFTRISHGFQDFARNVLDLPFLGSEMLSGFRISLRVRKDTYLRSTRSTSIRTTGVG